MTLGNHSSNPSTGGAVGVYLNVSLSLAGNFFLLDSFPFPFFLLGRFPFLSPFFLFSLLGIFLFPFLFFASGALAFINVQ